MHKIYSKKQDLYLIIFNAKSLNGVVAVENDSGLYNLKFNFNHEGFLFLMNFTLEQANKVLDWIDINNTENRVLVIDN